MLMRAIVIAMTCLLGSGLALAHSKMAKSIPAEGATTKAGLTEITLGFSKPVRLMLVKVRNAAAKSEVEAKFKPAAKFGTSYPFTVSPLTSGLHEVNWTAVAQDGHVMKGTLSFKVAD